LVVELQDAAAPEGVHRGLLGRLSEIVRSLHYDDGGGIVPWYATIPDNLLAPIHRLPTQSFPAGASVLAEGSKTNRIWILKEGAVEVLSHGRSLAHLAIRGSLIGEFSALLDQPHQADVRACEPTTLWVADARAFLSEPAAALYVATALARRLDAANGALLGLRDRLPKAELADGRQGGLLARVHRLLAVGS
jgi:CRP-like cAMP-binding protein